MLRTIEMLACVVVCLLAIVMIVWNIIHGFSLSVFIPFLIITCISIYYFVRAFKDNHN
ncbi:hypothetical protein [Staphylococcus warneri]|uniref:hypothetical protein n=1 Tax=Staphylococcus warneri TaxID=1292 RepID=UPI0002EC7072|nr:hypothetical protein [Staphylococcus warneri]CRG03569.1 Uncharacterised protein [Streptococcus pneumoniae]KEK49874.1 putative membrane protein [Staphylococcus warneri Lyso 1 2011]KEK56462.1 putative membrane protein [Staphylococcus warneri Lyso 2 2011]MBC3133193.1 hypothetical protein [Staphylococcus warneri]MBF0769759.1 hypothetical protein [Staphylococcus warneri]